MVLIAHVVEEMPVHRIAKQQDQCWLKRFRVVLDMLSFGACRAVRDQACPPRATIIVEVAHESALRGPTQTGLGLRERHKAYEERKACNTAETASMHRGRR